MGSGDYPSSEASRAAEASLRCSIVLFLKLKGKEVIYGTKGRLPRCPVAFEWLEQRGVREESESVCLLMTNCSLKMQLRSDSRQWIDLMSDFEGVKGSFQGMANLVHQRRLSLRSSSHQR